MPIYEYYSEEEERLFGSGTTFMVGDSVFAYDRRLADAINHVFNHFQVAVSLANFSLASSDIMLEFIMDNHPKLRKKATTILDGLSEAADRFNELDLLREQIVHQLTRELTTLVRTTTALAWEIDHERYRMSKREKKQITLRINALEENLSKIPFIDFHVKKDERPSIVRYRKI